MESRPPLKPTRICSVASSSGSQSANTTLADKAADCEVRSDITDIRSDHVAHPLEPDISATDVDKDDELTYTLDDDRFEIVAGQLKLKDGVSIDFEAEETVTVKVTVTDKGGLTDSAEVVISIINNNDLIFWIIS